MPLNPEALHTFLTLVSDKRARLAEQEQAELRNVKPIEDTENKKLQEIMAPAVLAQAEVKAHEDELLLVEAGTLSRQDYDEEHRRLEEAAALKLKECQEAQQTYFAEASKRMAPIYATLREIRKDIARMDENWKHVHEKRAIEAGLDLSVYYSKPER